MLFGVVQSENSLGAEIQEIQSLDSVAEQSGVFEDVNAMEAYKVRTLAQQELSNEIVECLLFCSFSLFFFIFPFWRNCYRMRNICLLKRKLHWRWKEKKKKCVR